MLGQQVLLDTSSVHDMSLLCAVNAAYGVEHVSGDCVRENRDEDVSADAGQEGANAEGVTSENPAQAVQALRNSAQEGNASQPPSSGHAGCLQVHQMLSDMITPKDGDTNKTPTSAQAGDSGMATVPQNEYVWLYHFLWQELGHTKDITEAHTEWDIRSLGHS